MKYIIEIEDEPFGRNDDPVIPHGMDKLYRAKGFKSLVFDKNGLDKLIPYTEPERKAIEDEVWCFAWEVLQLDLPVFRKIFGYDTDKMDYRDYKDKYEAWLEQKDKIYVGDEVTDGKGYKGIATYIQSEVCDVLWYDGTVTEDTDKKELSKTGRHFPEVVQLMVKMREDTDDNH